jgi:hypothetical protein
VEMMIKKRHETHKWSKSELIELRENYKNKVHNVL